MNRFSSVMLFGLSLCALSEVAAAQAGVVGVQPKSIHGPPALEIGADGDAEFLYVQGITRTAKGEIVVGNLGSREIQVFGPNGAMLRKFGRTGQGPGEFRNMAWLGRTADSIYIYDSSQSRVSVFSVSGGFVRSVSLAAITDRVYPHARIAVDRLVVLDFPGTRMEHPHGVFVDSVRVGLIDLRKPENVQWFRTIVGSSHLAINPDNTARAVAVGLYRWNQPADRQRGDGVLGRTRR